MPSTAALLDRAADHLTRAADLAEASDPAFAGQIRLAAATLPAGTNDNDFRDASNWINDAGHQPSTDNVPELLELAIDCLDQIPPLAGPADLQLCAWHLHELRRIATSGIAS